MDDEWELCNDDGFIYKRKKRRLTDPPPPPPPKPSAPATDPKAEERNRKQRKRKTLLKLKKEYTKEIHHWELLSNTLRAMQDKTIQFQQHRQMDETPSFLASSSKDACGSLVDELLLQVEAQEAIIHDVSNLCDVAETLCNAQEEQLKQSYIDLPIWASPRDLMVALCDDKEVVILGSCFHHFCHLIHEAAPKGVHGFGIA